MEGLGGFRYLLVMRRLPSAVVGAASATIGTARSFYRRRMEGFGSPLKQSASLPIGQK